MKRLLNVAYGAVQGTYWMYYAAIMSFSSVYLLGKNYTNTEIGVILAVASILAVIMQPLLADAADHSRRATLTDITGAAAVGLIIATASLYLFPSKSVVLSVVFILIGAWLASLQPLINSLAFYLGRSGYSVNFGITRSFGSVAYALFCAVLGSVVAVVGIKAIPASGIIVLALFFASLATTGKLYKKAAAEKSVADMGKKSESDSQKISLKEFVRRNKMFILFTVGIVLVFFQNSALNNYLMQIITAVGGTSSQLGHLFSFMALLELPGLFFFSRLRKLFSCEFMLKVASVAFVLKIFLVYMASSVAFIYVAFLLQLISFPIFLSASVHLVDEVMEKGEAVKGQSFITGMITLSGVFASLLGGIVLDVSGAHLLLFISTVLCVAGTVIVFASVGGISPRHGEIRKPD